MNHSANRILWLLFTIKVSGPVVSEFHAPGSFALSFFASPGNYDAAKTHPLDKRDETRRRLFVT